MTKLAVPLYAITLILSAFLLFSVQPMFSRMILPLLGGTPSVWNTAMVFFQAALLGGYAYAHLTTRFLSPRLQAVLHIVLLSLCALTLPFAIPPGTALPSGDEANPMFWQLGLMVVALGGPFLILSGCAPMLQRWFSTTSHKDAANPYFLYAASNFGSFAALIAYPTLIELTLGTQAQSNAWFYGYIALIVMIAITALMTLRNGTGTHPAHTETAMENVPRVTNKDRFQWLIIALIPSSLMLSVTTYITTDIASIPLIWIFPLSLYLITFIIAFARKPIISFNVAYVFQTTLMAIICVLFMRNQNGISFYPALIHLVAFFLCALTAHLALAARRPHAKHLTEFYLIISLGGCLGGVFNTLIAPNIFPVAFEYPIGLVLAMFVPFIAGLMKIEKQELAKNGFILIPIVLVSLGSIFGQQIGGWQIFCVVSVLAMLLFIMNRSASFVLVLGIMVVFIFHPGLNWLTISKLHYLDRNFFGVSRVVDSRNGNVRMFTHGTTLHGAQALIDPYKLTPLTYYYKEGPVGDIFKIARDLHQPLKIAALGLGTGTVTCHGEKSDQFDFYEIDPAVIRIAKDPSMFTFLSECGPKVNVIEGDARIKLAEAPDHSYDMIYLDVFSSDSIPVHMMTREAFEVYFAKLKPNGIIAINISNRHLRLAPLVASIAKDLNAETRFKTHPNKSLAPGIIITSAKYSIVTRNQDVIKQLDGVYKDWAPVDEPLIRPWTDDYANFMKILKFKF